MIEGRTAGIMGIRSHISYHFKAGAYKRHNPSSLFLLAWVTGSFDTKLF